MMSKISRSLMLVAAINTAVCAQDGFLKVIDAKNPLTQTTSPGFYKGAAWVDIDNDGDVDLFVGPNFLFRNDGNERFTAISDPFAFKPLQPPGGSSWADVNNDGY